VEGYGQLTSSASPVHYSSSSSSSLTVIPGFQSSVSSMFYFQVFCNVNKLFGGMGGMLENTNPAIFGQVSERKALPEEEDDDVHDEIDAREVFDILSCWRF